MGVPVAEVEVTGTDLRIDDQYTFGAGGFHRVTGLLNAKSGRGTGDIHVKSEAAGAKGRLDLDCHGGIGALHIGCGNNDGVQIRGANASLGHGLLGCLTGDFAHD